MRNTWVKQHTICETRNVSDTSHVWLQVVSERLRLAGRQFDHAGLEGYIDIREEAVL
jgi:hypothetical protein